MLKLVKAGEKLTKEELKAAKGGCGTYICPCGTTVKNFDGMWDSFWGWWAIPYAV